jgi:DNA (cytosine-5)-methyltransferase 1
MKAIDLFCGAGGLTHGFLKEKIDVVAGYDIEPACRFAYTHNNRAPFIEADISKVSGTDLNSYWSKKDIRILAGCAPCQPFSAYSNGRNVSEDEKWGLLYDFSRLVGETLPELITMENVPQLKKHTVFKDFTNALISFGYDISVNEIFCPDYGIPQQRKRLVLLASLFGPISLIKPTHSQKKYRTVRQTIADLPPVTAGETHPLDNIHRASKMNQLNMKRIQQSLPGGSWRDWDKRLIAKCHRKETGKSFPGVYGRMEWDVPAPTITTLCYGFGNGRFGHPEQDRALTLREAALLQTFPRNYQFSPKDEHVNMREVGKMIGNAVPVKLGQIVARSFKAHAKEMGLYK